MRAQESDSEFAPWSHEEGLPRNIIIEFQGGGRGAARERGLLAEQHKQKLSANLDRYIEKRRLRLSDKLPRRQDEPAQPSPEPEQKIQVRNIQPEGLLMNETVQISELFPSYGLKRSEKELTFYKPHRYQGSQEGEKRSPVRYSFKPRPDHLAIARNLTCKKPLHFSVTKRSFREEQREEASSSVSKSEHCERRCFTLKKQSKQQRFEDIVEYLSKRVKEKPVLQRTKTSVDPLEVEKCLRAKKHFYLNLPKIQFIEIEQ